MDTDVNQLKRSLARAIVWILLLLVVATGSTYAWFSVTGINSTNVTPMAGTVSKGNSSLLISNSESGPFDKTCELVLSGNPESLKPLSTENLESFFKAVAQNRKEKELQHFIQMQPVPQTRMPYMEPYIFSAKMLHAKYTSTEKI